MTRVYQGQNISIVHNKQKQKQKKTTWKHDSMEMRHCFPEGTPLLETSSIPIQLNNAR